MTLHQLPDGRWVEPDPPHCRLGHTLVPGGFLRGWSGVARTFFCTQDGHADDASRWFGPGGVPTWEGGAPDGEVGR